MHTLRIIAFHPERLREMILGNERKTVASLTTFALIVYLLFLLSIYASSSIIPDHMLVLFIGVFVPFSIFFAPFIIVYGPLIMVVFGLIFSRFVSTQQISFKQTFFMVCYVMLFWTLFFNAPTIILLIDYQSALLQGSAYIISIGLIILSAVHIVWFFNRSHNNSRLKVFGALVGSVVISYALLFGFFFSIMLALLALSPPLVV